MPRKQCYYPCPRENPCPMCSVSFFGLRAAKGKTKRRKAVQEKREREERERAAREAFDKLCDEVSE